MSLLITVLRRTPFNLTTRHNALGAIRTPLRSSLRVSSKAQAQAQTRTLLGRRFETTSATTKSTTTTTTTNAAATAEQPASLPPPRYAYPERLCVYHAGTFRITFLSCLKLSTLFMFAFFGFVVTPAYYNKEGFSITTQRAALSAIAPLIFVGYVTSPFVAFVHMRLPPFARQSHKMLRQYLRTMPPQTELDVTTMSFIAKPRVSRVRVGELRPVRRRFGIVNLARDTAAENATRKWWRFRAVGQFSIQQGSKAPRAPWAWDLVMDAIAARKA